MSQVTAIAGLAVRELWISFRLLLLVAAFVAAGALVALVPAPAPTLQSRLALGLGAAVIAAAAIAAWSVAAERRSGRAGWLVTRSVARRTLLAGWFAALAFAITVGIVSAAVLGWLAIAGVSPRQSAVDFVAVMVSIECGALAAIALGLAVGSVLPSSLAAIVATLIGLALGVVAWLVPGDLVPGAGHVALASLSVLERPVAVALRAAGAGLATTAIFLLAARFALERAEL